MVRQSEILSDPSKFRGYELSKTWTYLQDAQDKKIITKTDFELIKKYVNHRAGQSISPQTLHMTAVFLVRMREYIPKEYKALDIGDLQTGISAFNTGKIPDHSRCHPGRAHKPNTIVAYVNTLKAFLSWCIENKYISLSGIEKIKPPKTDKQTFGPQDILTKPEIEATIKACDNVRDRAFISTLFDGGFRSIELCTMTWGDLHWTESEEHEGRFIVAAQTSKKTGIPRRVLLTRSGPFLNEWKNQYSTYTAGLLPEGENSIFVNRKMKPFSYVTVSKLIQKLKMKVKEQGLNLDKKLKPHAFRRASITHECDDGRPISHVCMERWGKSYSPMILRYNQPGLEAIDSSKLEMSGIPTKRKYERHIKVMESKECPQCGLICKPLSEFCSRCGTPISPEAKEQLTAKKEIIDSELTEDDLIEAAREIHRRRQAKLTQKQ